MRAAWLLLSIPLIATAQFPAPILTGVLLERDVSAAGQFSLHAPDSQVFRYQFDSHTTVLRDGYPAAMANLNPGETVEVECEAVDASLLRHASMVRASPSVAPAHILADPRIRTAVHPPPEGTLTFSGVVARLNGSRFVLHTSLGERSILVRPDTRYLDNGGTVEAVTLQPNMRVFVSAGKNMYEQVEAYEVIWGQILEPKP